jgi:peptidoglycan/LPS O-acetylase OafA/YrhL
MKLKEIERLRAVAILMVLCVHWSVTWKFLPHVATASWSGVDLFFVISGYVVTLSLVRMLPPLESEPTFAAAFERASHALKIFWTRRFFRIVPAALATTLLSRFLIGVFPNQFGTPGTWAREVVAIIGGIYNYVLPYSPDFHFWIFWSLCVEEHFYLLLPVLFVALRTTSRRLGACAAIIGLCVLARLVGPMDAKANLPGGWERFASHLRFDSLMAGVAIALISSKTKPPSSPPILPKWLPRFVLLPACIALIGMLPGSGPDYVLHREGFVALWLLSGVVVAYAGLDRGYVLSVPVLDRVLEYLGSRSYALYLMHITAERINDGLRYLYPKYADWETREPEYPWRSLLALVAISLTLTELLHQLVEKPSIRIGRSLVSDPGRALLAARGRRVVAAITAALAVFSFRHRLMILLGPHDLALGKPVTSSSLMDGMPLPTALTDGTLEAEFGAHTTKEHDPWLQIDLGEPTKIGAIRVYNRADGYFDQQIPMEIWVSQDGKLFQKISRREKTFTQAWPWRVRVRGTTTARYVRLQTRKEDPLCLSEVEVFRSEIMAELP